MKAFFKIYESSLRNKILQFYNLYVRYYNFIMFSYSTYTSAFNYFCNKYIFIFHSYNAYIDKKFADRGIKRQSALAQLVESFAISLYVNHLHGRCKFIRSNFIKQHVQIDREKCYPILRRESQNKDLVGERRTDGKSNRLSL